MWKLCFFVELWKAVLKRTLKKVFFKANHTDFGLKESNLHRETHKSWQNCL